MLKRLPTNGPCNLHRPCSPTPMAYSDQPDSSAPFLSYKDYNDFSLVSSTLKRRRKLLLTLGAVVSLAIMVTLSTVHVVNRPGDLADAVGPSYFPNHTRITYPDGVKGPPTPRFRGSYRHGKFTANYLPTIRQSAGKPRIPYILACSRLE